MALPSATISFPSRSTYTFHQHLKNSKRILALIGAGLSASSGLATLRGVGSDGLWQTHDVSKLLRPEAFERDPQLVWSFHQERRQQALDAQPNEGHVALAKLAEKKGADGFLALCMNIDGLCTRAGHPTDQLLELHGSLFNLKCSNGSCNYIEKGNLDMSLGASASPAPKEGEAPSKDITIPKCPRCHSNLRPDIMWFSEALPKDAVAAASSFLDKAEPVDLVLVIGTTAQVWPAAGYVDTAIEKGARIAMVNVDRGDLIPSSGELGLTDRDWFFIGDAAQLLPELLKPVIDEFADIDLQLAAS